MDLEFLRLEKYLKNEDEDEDDLKYRRTRSEGRRTIWKMQIQRHDLENIDPKKKNRDLEWRTQNDLSWKMQI